MAQLEEDKWKALSAELMRSNFSTDKLAPDIWARSGFRCEYCQADLLRDLQIYGSAEGDHILPQTKYPRLRNNLNNYANACGTCNRLKRNWDPAGDESAAFAELNHLSNEQRTTLIDRCTGYLGALRQLKQEEFKRVLGILQSHSLR